MKIRKKTGRAVGTALFLLLTALLLMILIPWLLGWLPGQGPGLIAFVVIWGIYGGIYFHMMRENPWKGFDYTAKYLPAKDLPDHMSRESFQKISKYFSVSQHWICFRGQYVPKNFILGAYAVSSMDQSDTLHLALITGDTCRGFVYEKDTLPQLELLSQVLPQADIMNPGSLFTRWWAENRAGLARQAEQWREEGRDFWDLVYHWRSVTGWVVKKTSKVDDSEEYFRDYPEERPR